MRKDWVNLYRNLLNESEHDASIYSDDEILDIAKTISAPQMCEEHNIQHRWQFEMFWNMMINLMEPPENVKADVNISMFKSRVEENTN